MEKPIVIMNFTNVYKEEAFARHSPDFAWIDCTHLSGTDCYCDAEGAAAICRLIAAYPPEGIHFIDSGDYHYLTKFWTDKITEPFSLIVFDHHPDMQLPLFEEMLSCGSWVKDVIDTKQADGLVIHASVISKELDELVEERRIPHIVVGMPDFPNLFCWIDIDNRLAGEMAAKYLLECGYQSLAFIGGREEDKISMHRLSGVLSVLSEHDVLVPSGYVQQGDSVCDSGYAMMEEVLQQEERPDAIICANNYIAYGCVNALHDRNISIPEQIGVITFDDYPFSRILKPMLSVVNIDVYDMGYQTGKYILMKIKKPNLHVQSYITLPSLIVRESTKKEK